MMHHRITLLIREEPEGHGTLFIDYGGSLRALALIPEEVMGKDPSVFQSDLVSVLNNHLTTIAEAINDATTDSLEPPAVRDAQQMIEQAREHLAGEHAQAVMRFLSWLRRESYTVCAGGVVIDDDLDLLNGFAGDSNLGVDWLDAIGNWTLEKFAHWFDAHPWYHQDIPNALRTYLREVAETWKQGS